MYILCTYMYVHHKSLTEISGEAPWWKCGVAPSSVVGRETLQGFQQYDWQTGRPRYWCGKTETWKTIHVSHWPGQIRISVSNKYDRISRRVKAVFGPAWIFDMKDIVIWLPFKQWIFWTNGKNSSNFSIILSSAYLFSSFETWHLRPRCCNNVEGTVPGSQSFSDIKGQTERHQIPSCPDSGPTPRTSTGWIENSFTEGLCQIHKVFCLSQL